MAQHLTLIDELFAQLRSVEPLKAEDRNRLDKKFRLEFNYNSNHIEGNTLTYGETELLLIFDDTKGNHLMREYEEMKAHDVAYRMIEQWAKDVERPLTEQNIKNLNEVILVRPYWKDAITPDGQNTRRLIKVGDYKEYPNSVRLQNGEMFEYASPTDTPIFMQELIDWYRAEEPDLHPVTLAAMLHYKFVRIHPFDDGNGRISRLLMNYVLLKHGYPPVIIKSADKANYLRVLRFADVGDYEPLIDYVAEQVKWSLELSVKAAKGESIDEDNDFIKEIELLKKKSFTKEIPKSPKVIYETFQYLRDNLYRSVLNTLTYFESLFNEVKVFKSVNNRNEELERRSTIIDLIQPPINTQELKIFSYDIYKFDVKTINWRYKMLGLSGSIIPFDLIIELELTFDHYNYSVNLNADETNIYEINMPYGASFLQSDIKQINDNLKNQLLEILRKKIN